MTELSSALKSISDFGNTEVSILFSELASTVLFRPLDLDKDELLLELGDTKPMTVLESLAPHGRDFRSVSLFSSNSHVTCIPDGLFEETNADLYLESVFGTQRNRAAVIGHVPALSLHYVFGIDVALHACIQESFPQARIKHLCEFMLIEAWATQDHDDEIIFRLHQELESLFLVVLEGKELKLLTHHRIGDATDVVYHSLNTIHAMGIDHDKARLSCSGSLLAESEGFALLKSYCPNCEFKSAEFSALSAPHQFILAAQSYCE